MYKRKIAEKLVALRKEKGITQGELAERLSVSDKTVSKWENGSSTPNPDMLAALAQYFDISLDVLFGFEPRMKMTVDETIASLFKGLDRNEVLLQTLEIDKAISKTLLRNHKQALSEADSPVVPKLTPGPSSSRLIFRDFFDLIVSTEDANISLKLFRNESNFAWLKDADRKKKLVKIFSFLSDEDVLSVLYFLHTETCSECVTAEYVAQHTGVAAEKVADILDRYCQISACSQQTAHLAEGEKKVYAFQGDGYALAILTLAHLKISHVLWNHSMKNPTKMIGGD